MIFLYDNKRVLARAHIYSVLHKIIYIMTQTVDNVVPLLLAALTTTCKNGKTLNTVAMLDLLAEYDIKATFFVLGANAKNTRLLYCASSNEGHESGLKERVRILFHDAHSQVLRDVMKLLIGNGYCFETLKEYKIKQTF